MARFEYLKGQKSKQKKKAQRNQADSQISTGDILEPLEVVYIRKELLRGVWRKHKASGGESVSELVEELLSDWLQHQQIDKK